MKRLPLIILIPLAIAACNDTKDDSETIICIGDNCGPVSVKCNNGVLDTDELCEPGLLGGKTCAGVGRFVGGTLGCYETCRFDTSACYECTEDDTSMCKGNEICIDHQCSLGPRCGDGSVNRTSEQCDGSDFGSKGASCAAWDSTKYSGGNVTCTASCTVNYGACLDTHGCTSDQTWSAEFGCTKDAKCGDDKVNREEEACDGNDFGAKGSLCSAWDSAKYGGGNVTCRSNCTVDYGACLDIHNCAKGQTYVEAADACGIPIANADQLIALHNTWNSHGASAYPADAVFILTADIDLGKLDGWKGIGYDADGKKPFTATLLGNGKKIAGSVPAPLFYATSGANVSNLDVALHVTDNVNAASGAVARRAENGTFSDITVSGKIDLGPEVMFAGAAFGIVKGAKLESITVNGSLNLTIADLLTYQGGLVGSTENVTATGIHLNGTITAKAHADVSIYDGDLSYYFGGIVGYAEKTSVSDATLTGSIAISQTGVSSSTCSDCINWGHFAGLVGQATGVVSFAKVRTGATFDLSTTYKNQTDANMGIDASILVSDASNCSACTFDAIQDRVTWKIANDETVRQDLANLGRKITITNSDLRRRTLAGETYGQKADTSSWRLYNSSLWLPPEPAIQGANNYLPGVSTTVDALNAGRSSLPAGRWYPWVADEKGKPALNLDAAEADIVVIPAS